MTTIETERQAAPVVDAGEHKTVLPTPSTSAEVDAVADGPTENDSTPAEPVAASKPVEASDPVPAAAEPPLDPRPLEDSTPKFDRPENPKSPDPERPESQHDAPSVVAEQPADPEPSPKMDAPEVDVPDTDVLEPSPKTDAVASTVPKRTTMASDDAKDSNDDNDADSTTDTNDFEDASDFKDARDTNDASDTNDAKDDKDDKDDKDGKAAAEDPSELRRLPSSLSSSSVDDTDISTIPDPRIRLQRLASGEKDSEASDEITALSTKLIDAINHQSTLDDTLSRTRMELEEAQEKTRQLEGLVARQKEFLAGGLWVRKSTVEEEKAKVNAKAREERRLRMEAEAAKTKMELELETLTAELFLQANKMVTTAKEEAQAEQIEAQRRYDNLKAQLTDTEGLLRSQSEQLTELKQFMEEMIANEAIARDDQTTALTTPTTPEFGHEEFIDPDEAPDASVDKDTLGSDEVVADSASVRAAASTVAATPALHQVSSPDLAPPSPSQPMSFTHLLRPVLRYDTNAYHEFVDLVRTAQIQLMLQQQMQQAHSRSPSSTSLPKTPPMATTAWPGQLSGQVPSAASSVVSLSAMNTLASVASGLNASSGGSSTQNHTKELKETKFYKRVVVEDIEPTLRLDTAPGISWLVRRNIMTAILEGTLVAEPVPSTTTTGTSLLVSPCSMCGESRRQPEFLRQHRFRLTESDKSTPYPLCGYCLSRVRSVCGFLVFLRMIKEGHWRAPNEVSEQAAWEECVRLREHMFWARIGGGVLPAIGVGSGHHAGFGGRKHSRGSTRNSMIFIANGNGVNGNGNGGSSRPSLELPSQPNTPTKISVIGSPLASPPLSPNHPGLGIGASERASSSTPSRPSKLSVSLGSHGP